MTAESAVRARTQSVVALAAVLLAAFAQMTLQPTSAPLALELGLEPWHVGVSIAASAAMMLLAVRPWMRLVARHGPRGPLAGALLLATVALAAFAALAMLGARGLVDPGALVVAIVALRGLALGASLAAVVPAARLVISAIDDDALRVRCIAAIATVQGAAVVMGVALGGAASSFGALVPLVVAPALLAAAAVAVLVGVASGPPSQAVAPAAGVEPPRRRLVDAATWPFAAVALGVLASVACVQVVLGFVLRERLGLDAATTGFATGSALFVGGLAAVVTQTRVARAVRRPAVVARVGVVLATAGVAALVPAASLMAVLGAIVVAGAGVGLAMSGVAGSAATAAGGRAPAQLLVSVATVVGVVVGPPAGTLLLGISSAAPFVACAAVLAAASVVAFAHPAFRPAQQPTLLGERAAA
ncbi:hypothetical protein GCM10009846_20280 [Agrococcus versicolor]|uniref:MFS transporter n=1 Tax=Agrococcus versicolor TaxID=501482 RepID=A0ABN3ASX6_9MICO